MTSHFPGTAEQDERMAKGISATSSRLQCRLLHLIPHGTTSTMHPATQLSRSHSQFSNLHLPNLLKSLFPLFHTRLYFLKEVFFLNFLCRYRKFILHIIKFTHFKYTIQRFLVTLLRGETITINKFQNIFVPPIRSLTLFYS